MAAPARHRDPRHARGRRRRRRAHRADRRPRPRRRHRRGRHGGARLARSGKAAHTAVGAAAGRARQAADRQASAVDRLDALHTAIKAVRRGGTVSVSGVYGGEVDPMPMMEMFDRGITLRMGQCHVKRWIDDILPAGPGRRRPARHARPDHPPPAARPGAARLRDLPEEAGRLHQGGAEAVTTQQTAPHGRSSPAPPAASAGPTAHRLAAEGAHARPRVPVRDRARADPAGVRQPWCRRRRGRADRRRATATAVESLFDRGRRARTAGSTASSTPPPSSPTGGSRTSPPRSSTTSLQTNVLGTANVARNALRLFAEAQGGAPWSWSARCWARSRRRT